MNTSVEELGLKAQADMMNPIRFQLHIPEICELTDFVYKTITKPNITFIETEEGNKVIYDNIELTFIDISAKFDLIGKIIKWKEAFINGKDYKKDITVVKLNQKAEEIDRYVIKGCSPVSVNFNYYSTDHRQSKDLSYHVKLTLSVEDLIK